MAPCNSASWHDNLSHLSHLAYVLDVSDVQLTVEKCSRADQMFMRKHIHDMTLMLYRHDILSHLSHLAYVLDVSDVQLTVEKCSRADQMFMRKHIHDMTLMLYRAVILVAEDAHLLQHMDAIQCTMSLLCIEVGFDETLIELFRLAFALQSLAVDKSMAFSDEKRIALHNLVAKYMNLAAQLMANPSLCQHVQQVVACRARGPAGLNLLVDEEEGKNQVKIVIGDSTEEVERFELDEIAEVDGTLFDRNDVAECLKAAGKDVSRLSQPFTISTSKSVQEEEPDQVDGRSSPEHTEQVLASLRNRTFEDQADESCARHEAGDLSRTVSRLLARNADSVKMANIGRPAKPKNIFEMNLPSAFAY
ncbi:hypothetical protein TELCIR_11268 [Teladorsagia circumcincta]|uniref:Uncharacterized protein n=1 Tax=Teladorsagia circumcincta TaxID=45464 RepID=A0A2G9UB78_TELCI|nr:hypothetical protein TELCIR_11268 [Teladorsagia circumcincta]